MNPVGVPSSNLESIPETNTRVSPVVIPTERVTAIPTPVDVIEEISLSSTLVRVSRPPWVSPDPTKTTSPIVRPGNGEGVSGINAVPTP